MVTVFKLVQYCCRLNAILLCLLDTYLTLRMIEGGVPWEGPPSLV
jgi:hypothetical protein